MHAAGAVLAGLGLLGFLTFWSPPGPFLSGLFFYLFGIAAVAGGLLTVTSRNPIYSALWFASVVLSTAGLFVLAGAQFLAAGTVIVYAGAIIVTFLFVIMLAQMEGKAVYDRAARAPARATFTCFLLFWCLLYTLGPLSADHAPEPARARPEDPRPDLVALNELASFYQLHRARTGPGMCCTTPRGRHPRLATPAARRNRTSRGWARLSIPTTCSPSSWPALSCSWP